MFSRQEAPARRVDLDIHTVSSLLLLPLAINTLFYLRPSLMRIHKGLFGKQLPPIVPFV